MCISQQIGALLLAASFAALAQAASVHKWIDAAGVTHYSDEPPTTAVTGLERIEIPAAPDRAPSRDADYYSIANQWQRMHRERIELERARAARVDQADAAPRGGDTVVVRVTKRRHSVALLPHHRPGFVAPKSVAATPRRHPFAIPGRDWPVGLHPGRMRLRGGFVSR